MWQKKKPTIFIVEDDKSNHPLFQKAFADAGFTVIIRRTADGEFIEEVTAADPDIISMDIMIGKSGAIVERDGLTAAALLKSDERTKKIPIFFLTNFFEEGKVQKAKELGAVDFVSLQGHAITEIPLIFKRYLDKPKKFVPTNPVMKGDAK